MTIPASNHPVWAKLAHGDLNRIKTQQLSLQLLTKRLQTSALPESSKATEIRAFFEKYERILGPEIDQLASF